MYQEMKVYDALYWGLEDNFVPVFACRGMACDKLREWSRVSTKRAAEARVLYEGFALQNGEKLYRWVGYNKDKVLQTTAWYRTGMEAEEARDRLHLDSGFCQYGELDTQQIEPLQQPFMVCFELDDKGRPFTRINAHPEWDGNECRGKIFFPSRSFRGADFGEAIVSIEKEFETYGFLSGDMVQFGMPDMEKFLNWAWENAKAKELKEVLFINHPGRGKYLAVENGVGPIRITVSRDNEGQERIDPSFVNDPIAVADIKNYLERREPLTQLFLESAWGTEVDLDTLDAMFVRSRLFESRWVAVDWVESPKFRGKLFDSAVQKGILSQYASPALHIEVITLNWQNIVLLRNYSYDEVLELAKMMTEINQEADRAGKAKVKKGLLRPF